MIFLTSNNKTLKVTEVLPLLDPAITVYVDYYENGKVKHIEYRPNSEWPDATKQIYSKLLAVVNV
jgi:hypothetical protein